MTIGQRAREIRLSKGVTQAYINKRLGKSPGWLNNIEKGRRNIDADELKQIADILSVPIGEFFKTEPIRNVRNKPTGTDS